MADGESVEVDLQRLHEALELQEITFYEVSARLVGGADAESGEKISVETSWGVRIRHVENEFGVRVRADIETAVGTLLVDVAAEYQSAERLQIARDVAYEFVNNVALMQLFPYIRETASSLSAKVFGNALLMPVLQRGELSFDPEDGGPLMSAGKLQ